VFGVGVVVEGKKGKEGKDRHKSLRPFVKEEQREQRKPEGERTKLQEKRAGT
jgi:hypothetical protein